MTNITLQEFIDTQIDETSFEIFDTTAQAIIKLMIVGTHKEYAYDFLKIMFDEKRLEYTKDLFPNIINTEFVDFDLVKSSNRYIVTYILPCESDAEETLEYFSECFDECQKTTTEVVVDYYNIDDLSMYTRIFSHDETMHSSEIKID